MNSITSFSNFSDECKIKILSLPTKPRSLCETANKWGFSLDINESLRECFEELSKIALVCKDWLRLQQDNSQWKPVFDRCIVNFRHDIDFPTDAQYLDKTKLLIEDLIKYQSFFKECGIKYKIHIHNVHIEPLGSLVKKADNKRNHELGILHGITCLKLNVHNILETLFEHMISNNDLESLAKLLIFTPHIDADEIAYELITSPKLNRDQLFCFNLMIKLHYNLSDIFKEICISRSEFNKEQMLQVFFFPILHDVKGKTVSDLLASGCDFNAMELEINQSFLLQMLDVCQLYFYDTGKFELYAGFTKKLNPPLSFTDKKLEKHIRTGPITENDIKNVVFDLLCNGNLNLEMSCTATEIASAGTALSQFRAIAHNASLFPQPNAFTEALVEYDGRPNILCKI